MARRGVNAAERRRAKHYEVTLRRLADWPPEQGMPPLADGCSHIGILKGLEGRGLARSLPERDRLGSPRFVLTEAGKKALEGG